MGGYGSTRWNRHAKKSVVEDCRILSIFALRREGILEQGATSEGILAWRNAYNGKMAASFGYELNTLGHNSYLRVHYTVTRWNGRKEDFDYKVQLIQTNCNFGGARWWFTCPLSTDARECSKRVAKLYLPPSGRYFGCRHCYDLSYRSSQESDKRVSALRRYSVPVLLQAIKSGDVDPIIGLKALPDDLWLR